MEVQWVNLAILLFFVLLVSKLFLRKHDNSKKLPPSPPALPFIGHLHILKEPVHRTLHQLSEKYGHILFLQFGIRKVLLVSSPSAVEECFTTNDIIFANRPRLLAGKHLNYNYSTIGFASYGDHWRNLRRLTTRELFSTSRLAMFSNIRLEEVQLLLKQLFQDSGGKELKVDLSVKFYELVFNMMLRMIAGKRYYGKDIVEEEANQFRNIMKGFLKLNSSNLIDYLPVLKWVDVWGVEKRMIRLKEKLDKFTQFLLDESRRMRKKASLQLDDYCTSKEVGKMTLIEVMFSLQEKEPELYMDEDIKGLIHATLLAGTETSFTTIEWAMSLLLNHPQAMKKVVAEIEANVRFDHLLDESDLEKLTYLQNVINETFRLYPPAPLLLPHESSRDCKVCGYDVPQETMLLVNLWTMHRDPKLWVDADKFIPERFEGEDRHGYKLIPFGVGRRACPGAVLGRKVVGLVLAALLQSFEWDRFGEDEISMAEGSGVSIHKAHHLEALCKPRPNLIGHLSAL